MEVFWHDVCYTLRQLGKSPGFAILAIATLALGIGANVAMFTVIDSVLITPLPYRNPAELMVISQGNNGAAGPSSWADIQEWQKETSTFSHIGGFFPDTTVLGTSEGGLQVTLIHSTSNLPDILGIHPVLGRGFASSDGDQNAAPTAMISYSVWEQRFNGDRTIIGQQVSLGGVSHTIVGVLPASMRSFFGIDTKNSLWVPIVPTPQFEKNRSAKILLVLGRLKLGNTKREAQAEMDGLAARARISNHKSSEELRYHLVPLNEAITSEVRPALWALMGALGLVLLIACANVANLQLARYFGRQQEVAVRAALGAQRGRLIGQFLSTGVVLSILGATAGLGLADLLLFAARLLPPDIIPRTNDIHLRPGIFGILVLIAGICTILSSLAPALAAMRTNPQQALAGTGRMLNATVGRSRLSRWLVGGEVLLATVLLVGTGLMFRTLWKLSHLDLGFNADVAMFTVSPPQSTGPMGNVFALLSGKPVRFSAVAPVYSLALDRLRKMPGVSVAALSSAVPLTQTGFQLEFDIPGVPKPAGQDSSGAVELHAVSGDYTKVLQIPLIRGRAIQDDDTPGRPPVAVVNQAFAKVYFPAQDPVGQGIALALGSNSRTKLMFTIVGIVHDVPQMQLTQKVVPEIDVSYQQVSPESSPYTMLMGSPFSFVVRAAEGIDIAHGVRQIFKEVAPGYAAEDFRALSWDVQKAMSGYRVGFGLISAFSALAVIMVWAGLYGVLSQFTNHRRQEIGLRMALGADRQSIMMLILRQASILVGLGLAIGLVVGVFTSTLLRDFLFGITALDGWTYVFVGLGMLLVSLAAAALPAWRALSIEPMNALRAE